MLGPSALCSVASLQPHLVTEATMTGINHRLSIARPAPPQCDQSGPTANLFERRREHCVSPARNGILAARLRRKQQSIIEAIVTPEHLGADEKGGGAEYSFDPRLFGLFPQAGLGGLSLGLVENVRSGKTERGQEWSHALGLIDVLVQHKVELHDLTAELPHPGLSAPSSATR